MNLSKGNYIRTLLIVLNPLTPKSDQHLISPYNTRKVHEDKENDHQLKQLKKCMKNSKENMHTDGRSSSGISHRSVTTKQTSDRLSILNGGGSWEASVNRT